MKSNKWTLFFDRSSGGREKEPWTYIIVNLPIKEAVELFERKLGHSPYNITCDCCGEDYAISEYDSLEKLKDGHLITYKETFVILGEDYNKEAANEKA